MARMTSKMLQMSKDVIENYEFEVAEELGMSPKVRSEKWSCISKLDNGDEKVNFRNCF